MSVARQTADRPDGCLRFEMLDRSLDAAMLELVMGGTEYMVQFFGLAGADGSHRLGSGARKIPGGRSGKSKVIKNICFS